MYIQNALDLDIRIIKQQLAVGTPTSFNVAYAVYDKGAFCDPIAKIQLGAPLPKPLSQGDTIAGFSTGGVNEVHATLIDNTAKGETEIHVAYEINQMQSNYVGCQVGGNPNPRTERCTFFFFQIYIYMCVCMWAPIYIIVL